MYKQGNQNTFRSFQSLKRTRSKNRNKRQTSQQEPKEEYSSQVYRKFLHILNARRERYLKQNLVQYYGKNFPIDYRQHYNFEQGWEYRGRQQQKKRNYINESSSFVELVIAFITILVYAFTIWMTNLDTFYRSAGKFDLYYQTYSVAFVVSLLHFYLRYNQNPKILEVVKYQYSLIMAMGYLVVKLAGADWRNSIFWIIFQLGMLFILYKQASMMYQSIRLTNFSLLYEYQIRVLDMAITIFIVAHFIAITLYLATHFNPSHNWMSGLDIDRSNEYVVYAYSFYFCTTTIMTVGYGDITPKNEYEVVVVVFVQIFGVIVLGYIINQIGYCVSSLRRGQQLIEKDLIVVQKMRKHYRMDPSLANRVREYIVNSKPSINQLSPEEQTAISNKLNEEIRADLVSQNMLAVVKSSIFFLCRWSKQFQNQISMKLIHLLFNPNDLLYQPIGNERIYIIKRGKIDIYAGYNTKRMHKVLKTINSSIQSEVSDNCYGYTGVISVRKPKIYAVSKGFTSAYYIDKQKFKQSVNYKITDIEYYHQLKTKIDHARLCESIQINSSQSTKHHYHPTRSLLVKKQSKKHTPQGRQYYCRRQKGAFRGNKQFCDTSIREQIKNRFMGSYTQLYDDSQVDYVKQNTVKTVKEDEICKYSIQISINAHLEHFFQSSREYTNYFAKNNKSKILKALQNEQFIIKPCLKL